MSILDGVSIHEFSSIERRVTGVLKPRREMSTVLSTSAVYRKAAVRSRDIRDVVVVCELRSEEGLGDRSPPAGTKQTFVRRMREVNANIVQHPERIRTLEATHYSRWTA